MLPFLLAALPLAPVATNSAQPETAPRSNHSGALIAAQPASSANTACPAPVQSLTLANSGTPRAAGNNFNLAAVTGLFPTNLASRPSMEALNVPLTTTGLRPGNAKTNSNGSTEPPCSTATTLVAAVEATPQQGRRGFGLAGATVADALFDPSSSNDAQLAELLGENKDYSLTSYHKASGFNRRLNGWLTFDTTTSTAALRNQPSNDGYLVGTLTLTFTKADGSDSPGVDYPVVHLASLGGASRQLKLSKINGNAAPANAVVRLSGRNLAVANNSLSNSTANAGKAFGSATIKGQGIRSLSFDVYARGDDTNAGQNRFFLSLSSAKEAPLTYAYGSVQAGVGFPEAYSGTFSILGVPGQRNTLSLNTGFNGELAAGYRGTNIRSDISVGYSNFGNRLQTISLYNRSGSFIDSASTPGSGNVNLWTVMANGYYDFKIRNDDGSISRWSPYLGAGVGYGSLSSPSCSLDDCTLIEGGSGGGVAYQLKAGVSYRANESSRLFLEGGYLGIASTNAGNVDYDSFGSWRINLGWRQAF